MTDAPNPGDAKTYASNASNNTTAASTSARDAKTYDLNTNNSATAVNTSAGT